MLCLLAIPTIAAPVDDASGAADDEKLKPQSKTAIHIFVLELEIQLFLIAEEPVYEDAGPRRVKQGKRFKLLAEMNSGIEKRWLQTLNYFLINQ